MAPRNPLNRLSSTGYRFLKRLGFSPSSNLFYRAQRKGLNKGIWAETKLALFDEAAAQKQGGSPLFARRLLDAVSRLPERPSPLTRSLFLDGVITEGQTTPSDDPELTKGQNDALSKCLGNDITFLMGAPGTGKTRVTAKTVSKLLEQNESVLFCCSTRAALEHAASHLSENASGLTLKTVASIIADENSRQFDTVLVDEAGMVGLAEILVLSSLAGKRMIFVGDPFQLPPISATESPWLNQNIFRQASRAKTLSSLYVWQRHNHSVAILLREQFDIPERISGVLSHFCYGGRLFSRSSGRGHLLFLDTASLGAVNEGKRSSPVNPIHAECVIDQIKKLLTKGSVRPEQIGVLTPFTAQASFLEKNAKAAGLPSDIEIGTVHTFQGRLKNCLILDLTAAGVDYTYRSLADDALVLALMNSALSRCRTINSTEGRLIVIADLPHIRQQYPQSVLLQILNRLYFRADMLQDEDARKYAQTTNHLCEMFSDDWESIDTDLGANNPVSEQVIRTLIYNACDLIPRLIALCNRIRPGAFDADNALAALEKPYAALALADLSDDAQFDPERIDRFKSIVTDLYKIIYESTMRPVPGEHRNRGPEKPIYDPDAENGESYGRVRIWIRELRNYYQHDSEKPEDYRKDFSKRQRDFTFQTAIGRDAPEERQGSDHNADDYSTREYLRVTLFIMNEIVQYLMAVKKRLT